MSTFPMQTHPNHPHFFSSPSSTAPSTSHYHIPPYWYNNPTTFGSPNPSPAKRKRDGSFDDQDSSSSDDGGLDRNASSHRGSHGAFHQQASHPPPRPVKRIRREWNNSTDDGTGLGGTRPAGMENGFARMTLLNPHTGAPTFVQEPMPIQQQPPLNEVHMKTRSWYEPEKDRIVVLNLDDSDTESETSPDASAPSRSSTQSPVDENMGGNPYTISQAYLSRIKGVPQPASPPTHPYHQAGSLILYKGLPNLAPNPIEDIDNEPLDDSHPNYVLPKWGPIPVQDDRPLYATIEEVDDDDDVEMMEMDA
ncbi:hypothetical protein FRB90_004175 [Tulasnella sp. 427]|nr:hypothetical protein FRB90_004175 [Tulasnella sp. 427]